MEVAEDEVLDGLTMDEESTEGAEQEQEPAPLESGGEEPEAKQEEPEPEAEAKPEDPFKGIEFSETQERYIQEKVAAPLVGRRKEVEEDNRYLRGLLKQHGIEETGPKPPEVPKKPDPFDPDYDKKIEERDAIIAQRATWQQQQEVFSQQQQQRIQAELEQRNAKYYQAAAESGIQQASLLAAGDKVLSAATTLTEQQAQNYAQTIDYIMRHESGPKITMYLSETPAALQTLASMNPMAAVETIATKIAPFLDGKTQQRQDPPEPAEQLKGGGAAKLSEEDQMIADMGLEVD